MIGTVRGSAGVHLTREVRKWVALNAQLCKLVGASYRLLKACLVGCCRPGKQLGMLFVLFCSFCSLSTLARHTQSAQRSKAVFAAGHPLSRRHSKEASRVHTAKPSSKLRGVKLAAKPADKSVHTNASGLRSRQTKGVHTNA